MVIFYMVKPGLSMGNQNKSTIRDIIPEKEVIAEMNKLYAAKAPSTDGLPSLRIISPGEGGRVLTNKDKTFVTISIESHDNKSGVKMVCGARVTNVAQPEFIIDGTPPYVLVFENTPLGPQKFMIFTINNAGVFTSRIMNLNVIKVHSFHIVPRAKQ